MVDPNGRIQIENYYDSITPPSDKERQALLKLAPMFEKVISEAEITHARTFDNMNNYELMAFYSTFNINGLQTGAVGKEARTIIPKQAIVSIDSRLVPNQVPSHQEKLIANHVEKWRIENNVPKEAVTISFEHAMAPIKTSFGTSYFKKTVKAAKFGFDKEALEVPRLGGSLPIYLFDEYLNKPVVLVPYALPDEKNHAPNENLDIPFFESGVATTVKLLMSLIE